MAKKKRTEMAPVLQTIKDYLANHYMDELLQEITAGMRVGDVQGLDMDCSQGEIIVDPDKTALLRADMYRVDRTHAAAVCKVRIKFGISREGRIPRYVIRYINFSASVVLDGGITLESGIRDMTTSTLAERELPALTKYMVPVLNNDEMEILVLEMLQHYLGKNAFKDRTTGGEELARAMGLTVTHASLYRNHHTGRFALWLPAQPAPALMMSRMMTSSFRHERS